MMLDGPLVPPEALPDAEQPPQPGQVAALRALGRGMIRLETLIELKFFNSSFSSSSFSIRSFRAYPLLEIGQTAPCRAARGKSSDSRQQYLSRQHPPPLLGSACSSCWRRCGLSCWSSPSLRTLENSCNNFNKQYRVMR